MTNSQESEGNLNFGSNASFSTTTYTYELDFVQDNFRIATPWFHLPIRIFKAVFAAISLVTISSLKLTWESLRFTAYYTLFIQKKLVALVYTFEGLKDGIVKILLWRRGLLFRPTTHGGVLLLASIAFIIGSLFRSGVTAQDFTRAQVLVATNTTQTIIPEGRPRSEVISYKVQNGDKISKVASAYSVSVDTIKWANDLSSVDEIKPGDTLA